MTHDELVWLSGFIDGEGYIGITKKSDRFQAHVRIATTHKNTMEFVSSLLGAPLGFHNSSKNNGRWKPCYRVAIYDKRAEELCRKILPYLKTKKLQSENLLAFRETIEFGRNQFSPKKGDQSSFWLKSKRLNQRGMETKET